FFNDSTAFKIRRSQWSTKSVSQKVSFGIAHPGNVWNNTTPWSDNAWSNAPAWNNFVNSGFS
ncbi:MAG: hypothetical protein WBY88_17210, partial [Desulfosarcina sp.]